MVVRRFWLLVFVLTCFAGTAAAAPADPVAQLQCDLDQGKTRLSYDPAHGYLKAVLDALKIPVDSQGLVFSKTSLQANLISPEAPRAVYFNDDVYVGWVRNGQALEIASVDPAKGPVFYLLPQKSLEKPKFLRQEASCLQCHQSQLTHDVPGLLMRSVYPDHQGMPVFSAGTYLTTDQSPMNQRWGGWYMDGKVGDGGMGNAFFDDPTHPKHLSTKGESLSDLFDTAAYLSPHGDPVPLLVLAHQTNLHNLLTKAAQDTRVALLEEKSIFEAVGREGHEGKHLPSTMTRISAACDPVVKGLLFSGEAAIELPIEASTDYAKSFEKLGPFDHQGRSLRQFDLKTRMFRYPCSYLIYSGQFDNLPGDAKAYIYRKMWKVLTGRDDSPAFAHLSDSDREAIYQILAQTKSDLPAYWKSGLDD
jgi:hypothetical protein